VTPKVSIVTPSYNQGRYVARTVRSVLLQDYPNLEYIFLDGGSTDATMAEVEPYLKRFAYWRSGRDGGQADAVQEGLRRASGDVMAYLNSDDLLAPGTVSRVVRFFERHPRVDAVYSNRVVIDENDRIVSTWLLPPHSNYLISRWDLLPQETCFWRRDLFERAGNVDPSMAFALDYDLFVRYMMAGQFARLNAFLGAFRRHGASKTVSQYESIGMAEVAVVMGRYGIRIGPLDRLVGKVFTKFVTLLGAYYVRFPGSGWPPFFGAEGLDYDQAVWNGMLRSGASLPAAPADG
jgi:glycosyltransferase involved in cell wall biosynthesis